MEGVRAQVEAIRKKLLDLSLRNRMLNYRPSKRLGITVVGENSFQVHRLLVEESKAMSFVGKPDPPRRPLGQQEELYDFGDDASLAEFRRAAEEEMDAFLTIAAMPVDQMDTKLSTDELESILQAKLRSTLREATLANDELGINTLFLTLGTLEWCETADRSYRAPLIFVPVVLKQQANGSLRLYHDGSDVGTNLPLRAKLAEFNIKLPELNEDKTLLDYFTEVEATIRSRDDWTVHRDDICLGFFNYEKYAMYVDLGGDSWPEVRKPWMDADLISMLSESYPAAESDIDEQSFIDDHRPVAECHEVYDADSSQTLAMIRAASGLSMVIEGPPGTGKSQTITNIIAEAVAAGKSVLFVSAKRAALDVVKRRLAEAELGDMCLDLHDKLTNRREFYSEIKRTAGMHLHVPAQEERVNRLTELRDKLNRHSRAVNEPVEPYGLAPFTAMSILAGLPKETAEDREGRIPFESLKRWKHSEIGALKQSVLAFQSRIGEAGVPTAHPFWGSQIAYVDPAIRLDLEQELSEAARCFSEAVANLSSVSERLKIPAPASIADVRHLRASAERIANAPPLDGVAIQSEEMKAKRADIESYSIYLLAIQRFRSEKAGELAEAAWQTDAKPLVAAFELHMDKWYRFLIGEYRSARNTVRSWLGPRGTHNPQEQLALLRSLKQVQDHQAAIAADEALLKRLFGPQWRGLDTDPQAFQALAAWIFEVFDEVQNGSLPAAFTDFFVKGGDASGLLPLVENAEKAVEKAAAAYSALATSLKSPQDKYRSEPIDVLRGRIDGWQQALPRLGEYIALMESRRSALEKGLEPVVAIADVWPLAAERLADSFARSYYTGVIREAMESRPELRTFERVAHEAAIAEFQSLDDFKLRYNRAQVRLIHYRNIPRFENAVGNLHQLKLQCELQRRHKPIRWIMSRAGEAVQRIKPVFMMSPLSVAIHLPPELPPFDLVIFDEASQVKPEDALCAIIRAKQTIVVGDTRQMPPTSFFDRVADDELEEDQEDASTEVAREAAKLESVLSLMSVAAGSHVRRPDLQWHYRSLHPSLIQPSNELFYENRLIVFPSPGVESAGRRIGVVFHHHPETVYEGGDRRRINRMEAEIVAQAVLRHVTECPDQSLMVAAMNKAQADLIYVEVQKLERQHPEVFAAFKTRHPHEHLDVKNLENVQGDERDVVYISVTYGRDAAGVIRQQFGPLLRDGGERRLNVLITRARMRCEVFSNITAEDLRVEANQRGLVAMKRYLSFAESGRIEVPVATGMAEESPFEEEVSAALRDRGYQVDTQVGTEGCRIDLAVIDPESPSRYVLGVECDGASYHSSRSARDRDKLRQTVLESRGWVLHRIWSTDWWQNRDAEIARLVDAIDRARADAKVEPLEEEIAMEPLVVQVDAAPKMPAVVKPYVETPEAPIGNEEDLKGYLVKVVNFEGPIAHELLILRLRNAAGYSKMSGSIRAWFDGLISWALATQNVRQSGACYFAAESQLAVARDWSQRPAAERKFDFVSDVEVRAVLRTVIESAFGVGEDEAIRESVNLLGFKRVSDEAKSRVRSILAGLLAEGGVTLESGSLTLRKQLSQNSY